MIRLKKQAEAEKAAAATAATAAGEGDKMEVDPGSAPAEATPAAAETGQAEQGKVTLLGIGGRRTRKSGTKAAPKKSPGEIRIQKDVAELDGGDVCQVSFPDPNNLCSFKAVVTPDSGYWKGASYHFSFTVPPHYPHDPPKVQCNTTIYHPNINLAGNVCLNILREDWKPVLDINAVIYGNLLGQLSHSLSLSSPGLIYLFYEPNPEDPLNIDAARIFRTDKKRFEMIVRRSLQGGHGE
ncbi:unnamed protein product [Chrysoparadoxa australica]